MPTDVSQKEINIEYPDDIRIDKDVNDDLPVEKCLYAKVDAIAGNYTFLISEPIPTGVAVNNVDDAKNCALQFAQKYPNITGIPADELRIETASKVKQFWNVILHQKKGKYDVIGGRVKLRINNRGEIFYYSSSVKPMKKYSDDAAISGDDAFDIALDYLNPQIHTRLKQMLAIAPIPAEKGYSPKLVWWLEFRTKSPLGLWIFWVDAKSGEILRAANEMPTVDGSITGEYLPEYHDDTPVVGPFTHEYMILDSDYGYTDGEGLFFGMGSVADSHYFYTTLSGRYCEIEDHDYTVGSYSFHFAGENLDFVWLTAEYRTDQLNLYYHTNWIHNWVKNFLGYTGMDYQMPARCNDTWDPENAYYDGEGINFGGGGEYMHNLALFADVIYHEYTHGVTHHIYPPDALPYEGQPGAIDEGLSDYFPCSIFDDPLMGEGTFVSSSSTYMRNLHNSNRYPEDFVNEVHHDGQIIAGAWWDIREELGANYTDSLVHFARFLYPEDFEEYLYAVLSMDDDDGNLENGTPNAPVIYNSFHNHGIGPENFLEVVHEPLPSTEDTANPYIVECEITSFLGLDSAVVYYRVLGVSSWEPIELENVSGDIWSAAIPPQSLGSIVHYYIRVRDIGDNTLNVPAGGSTNPYFFQVAQDTIPPTIEHIPLSRGNVSAWSPNIFAKIEDSHGIDNVTFRYKVNDVSYHDLEMEYDAGMNGWITVFDCDVEIGDVVKYKIIAQDISTAGNTTVFPSEETWVEFTVERDYFDDIETGGYDFSHYNITTDYLDMWHIETYRTYSGEYSYKCGGDGIIAYDDLVDAALETPFIYISEDDTLSFYHWMDAETSNVYIGYAWDGGVVEMSTDGGTNWSQIEPTSGYPFVIRENPVSPFPRETPCLSGRRAWQHLVFPLNYNGYAKFRFRFGSDGYLTREGWYIDDVRVTNHNWVSVFENDLWKPKVLALKASPNPFNNALLIETAVPENGNLRLDVMDISGKLVRHLYDGEVRTGIVRFRWEPDNIPAGIYLVRVLLKNQSDIEKIFFVK
ncbi:hypothetical protein DRQ33_06010 [bacterium]|nr:MAG: hypothetical protein DRQ33_06010 [bacterium]